MLHLLLQTEDQTSRHLFLTVLAIKGQAVAVLLLQVETMAILQEITVKYWYQVHIHLVQE